MLAGQLALVAAALFAGAAIYVNVAEQPARLDLGDKALFTEWRSAYKRGFAMQAPLALVGSVLGLLARRQTDDRRWLLGAVVPCSLTGPTHSSPSCRSTTNSRPSILMVRWSTSRMLIEQWGRLHTVRSVLGLAATLVFLWASMR